MTLDKKHRKVIGYLLFEIAGHREESLVTHSQHNEAVVLNSPVE